MFFLPSPLAYHLHHYYTQYLYLYAHHEEIEIFLYLPFDLYDCADADFGSAHTDHVCLRTAAEPQLWPSGRMYDS